MVLFSDGLDGHRNRSRARTAYGIASPTGLVGERNPAASAIARRQRLWGMFRLVVAAVNGEEQATAHGAFQMA
jgi:hypothetical protein